ncbi:hypothetical protein COU96_01905, partial [Candidatus Shapirobacteria bacterium CG10_big_fil_rev_8_21_14_0_10_38_14]
MLSSTKVWIIPKIALIILAIALLFGAIYFVVSNKKSPQSEEVSNNINEYQSVSGNEQTFTIAQSEDGENNIYTDSQYKFSFEYPKNFTATKFQEGEEGDTILVQEKESKKSFQIFISPFDEPGPLTKERVKQDLPDLIINNPEQRVLKNGAVALVFFSEESSIGETREIWFVHNGYLYQISTYK